MTQPPAHLPSHLSVDMFRRFEPLIAQAVEAFPKPTKFTPSGEMSLTTFSARFRDSVASFRRFNWSPTFIDTEKFTKIDGSFVIKHDIEGGCTWFVQRGAAGRAPSGLTVPGEFVPAPKATPNGALENLTDMEMEALCLLLSNKRIVGPVLIKGEVNPTAVQHFHQLYDIAFTFDSNSNTTILL